MLHPPRPPLMIFFMERKKEGIPYIALLRGINVGGRRALPMKALKALWEELGFEGVKTYIQSGNLLFRSPEEPRRIVERGEAALLETFGFSVPLIVLSRDGLGELLASLPFRGADPARVVVAFLRGPVSPEAQAALSAARGPGEELRFRREGVVLHCPGGYGKTKLSLGFIEKKTGCIGSARNERTLRALYQLGADS